MRKLFSKVQTPYRYRVLILLCALTTLTYMDRICISIVGVRIKAALHLNKEQFGWVIRDLTPKGIADAIADVYANRSRLNEFAGNAYTKSPRLFSWTKISKEYAEYIYQHS